MMRRSVGWARPRPRDRGVRCLRQGCLKPVPPGQRLYCSERCNRYRRQRRYVVRKQGGTHCPHCHGWVQL